MNVNIVFGHRPELTIDLWRHLVLYVVLVEQRMNKRALCFRGIGAVGNVAYIDRFAGNPEAHIFDTRIIDQPSLEPALPAGGKILARIAGMSGDQRLKD